MAARNLREAIYIENTIKFGREIREWIGEEWIDKCYDPDFLSGAAGSFGLILNTCTLTEAERSALEQKVMLRFNARSAESFVDRVEIDRTFITFHMISQVVDLFV